MKAHRLPCSGPAAPPSPPWSVAWAWQPHSEGEELPPAPHRDPTDASHQGLGTRRPCPTRACRWRGLSLKHHRWARRGRPAETARRGCWFLPPAGERRLAGRVTSPAGRRSSASTSPPGVPSRRERQPSSRKQTGLPLRAALTGRSRHGGKRASRWPHSWRDGRPRKPWTLRPQVEGQAPDPRKPRDGNKSRASSSWRDS